MQITLTAQLGRATGSRASRRLRREGLVPGIVYGSDLDPVTVAVDHRELMAALRTEAGVNAIINLDVDGGDTYTTLAREIKRHPYRSEIDHVDFVKISLTEAVDAEVYFEFEGEPAGVKNSGGIIETLNASVNISALATQIPSHIMVDISEMDINDVLTLDDITPPEGVTFTDDPEMPVVTISLPAAEVAEEAAEGEEEGVEGEEPVDAGEEPAGDDDGE